MTEDDPVRARRARLGSLAVLGQRLGYGAFAVAVVAFFVGVAGGYSVTVAVVVVAALALGSAVLAPAIVLGFAVKAAEREDRPRGGC